MRTLYQSTIIHVGLLLLLSNLCFAPLAAAPIDPADLALLELQVLGASKPASGTEERLRRLEEAVYGTISPRLSSGERLGRLKATLLLPSRPIPKEFELGKPTSQKAGNSNGTSSTPKDLGTANNSVIPGKLANIESLAEQMIKIINEERSIRHLNPLRKDEIASKVAFEQANFLAQTGQFSNYGTQGKNPDIRYTEAGGTGRVSEVVDGFFASSDENQKPVPVSYSENTPHLLMDAINETPDKADAVFSNEANLIGVSFVTDPEKRQLVTVIEIAAQYGSFASLPRKIGPGAIEVSGQLADGYKLAWIGLSQTTSELSERNETEPSPYFAPIDKVVYLDQTGSKAKSIATAGGVILAMVAAPFTYGASAIVADILLNMVAQTYQLQDVQVRNGAKTDVDGNFRARVDLGEWGPGVYYVSVWALRGKKDKPIVISRRTITVG